MTVKKNFLWQAVVSTIIKRMVTEKRYRASTATAYLEEESLLALESAVAFTCVSLPVEVDAFASEAEEELPPFEVVVSPLLSNKLPKLKPPWPFRDLLEAVVAPELHQ